MCKKDAQTLYEKGEGKIGTDEKAFVDIFTTRFAVIPINPTEIATEIETN
jgi:hypothetical protein